MNPRHRALDRLDRTEDELRAVQAALDVRRRDPALPEADRAVAAMARAHAERTYLLRLMSEFEGAVTDLGPRLEPPVEFFDREGLAPKLERLGAARGVDPRLRVRVDEDVRDLRNDLAHGRSPIPRAAFEDVHALMRAFVRSL